MNAYGAPDPAGELGGGEPHADVRLLGSVDAISNSAGAVQQKTSFDPFGGRRATTWNADLSATGLNALRTWQDSHGSRGFTDHEHLNRTGFVHMNGRVYDPRIGRFVSPDPIVQAPWFSQSYNRYAYVFNSPLSYTDPSGYEAAEPRPRPVPRPRPRLRSPDDFEREQQQREAAFRNEMLRQREERNAANNWNTMMTRINRAFGERDHLRRKAAEARSRATSEIDPGLETPIDTTLPPSTVTIEVPQSQDGGAWIPGAQAGHEAATYWADRVVASTLTEDPLARVGLAFAVLWTPDTAGSTALTLASAGTLVIAQRAGVLWFRAYPNAGGEGVGIDWGGKNVIRFDWHRFRHEGRDVFRPHIDSKPLGLKHWPWQ